MRKNGIKRDLPARAPREFFLFTLVIVPFFLVQSESFLKISPVQINSKLNSKLWDYLQQQQQHNYCWALNLKAGPLFHSYFMARIKFQARQSTHFLKAKQRKATNYDKSNHVYNKIVPFDQHNLISYTLDIQYLPLESIPVLTWSHHRSLLHHHQSVQMVAITSPG